MTNAPEAAPQAGGKRLKLSAAAAQEADLDLTEQVRPLDIVAHLTMRCKQADSAGTAAATTPEEANLDLTE